MSQPLLPEVDEFERFWAVYPRKANKATARRAFPRARAKASMQQLLDGVARYRWSDEPHFQPHAATWLNQERWDDAEAPLQDDPWGLYGWLQRQPAPPPEAMFWPTGWAVEAYRDIMLATGMPPTWRGDLHTLERWITDGYRPDSIFEVVATMRLNGAARSLRVFDASVRRLALQWSPQRQEWIRQRPSSGR